LPCTQRKLHPNAWRLVRLLGGRRGCVDWWGFNRKWQQHG